LKKKNQKNFAPLRAMFRSKRHRLNMQRGYVNCRYGQLHYRTGGVGEKTLVLLHQTPSSGAEFLAFAEEMAKDRRVIAFDTPGNGMSDSPAEPLSMADYAAAFADGLDALGGGQKYDLLGCHTGAYLAAELAIARPDLVTKLILCGIAFRPAAERAERLSANPLPALDEAAMKDFVTAQWQYIVAERHPAMPLGRALDIFADRIRPWERASWPYQGVWRYDAEARFALVTQPTLVLQPHEPLFPHWRDPVYCLVDAKVIEFPDLHKDVFDVGSEKLARAIREWDAREQKS
jgi:pimeloyl-ACP methyl ester carboxylesterase